MGFRLYIKSPFIKNEHKEICFGKLYGYLEDCDDSFHSYSLDYLLSIDFFEDYDLEDYDKDPYKAAVLIFDCMTYGEFEIEYKYFLRFISLYISDRAQRFKEFSIDDYIDDYKYLADLNGLSDNEIITLYWG